jgi:hypothetical protein
MSEYTTIPHFFNVMVKQYMAGQIMEFHVRANPEDMPKWLELKKLCTAKITFT